MGATTDTTRRRSHGAQLGAAALAIVVLIIYVLLPRGGKAQIGLDLAFQVFTLACAFVAMHRHQAGRRRAWVVLCGAMTLYVLGNALFYSASIGLIRPLGFPSVADALVLCAYVLLGAALALFHGRQGRDRARPNWGSLADALIVTGGAAVASWEFLIEPVLKTDAASLLARLTSVSFPLLDLFLLAVATSLALRKTNRSRPLALLGSFVLFQLVGDTLYGLGQVAGTYRPGGLPELCWMASLALLAATALDPGVEVLSERNRDDEPNPGWGRQALLTAAALIAPVFLMLHRGAVPKLDLYVEGGIAAALFVLAIARVGGYGRRLAHLGRHDSLTGLPNRSLLLDRLRRAVASQSRRGGSVAVLGLDLDRFKVVNDSLGHAAGDELLVRVGERLVGAVRESDTVARFGGDEFVLLCEDVDGEGAAVEIARRVLAALEEPVRICGRDVRISMSVGIAGSDRSADADELLRSADLAMYSAKSHGGGRIEVFDEALSSRAVSRLELEADLRRAIAEREFRVFYQPVMALESGAAVGVEALVRWEHPERGLISPAEFIPTAEETGLIVALGSWVLEEACRQVAEWQRLRPGTDALSLSVNVSARQFADAGLSSTVHAALESSGLHPEALCLEITETTVMSDPDASARVLRELKLLGVGVSIDDFGTGYSSMAALKKLPVDVLKIDRAFVSGVDGGPEDRAIVAAVVHLAEALELDVVAEGVERPAQALELRRLGCAFAQGFDWSRPLPAHEARAWLDAHVLAPDVATTGDAVGRYRVLVADDLPEHRRMVRRVLERNGSFTVVAEAADGRAAVEMAALHQPDLVVLDIGMPKLDGCEALPLIRQVSSASRVVVLSGDVGEATVDDADAVLEKGLAPHRLVGVLLDAVAGRSQDKETC